MLKPTYLVILFWEFFFVEQTQPRHGFDVSLPVKNGVRTPISRVISTELPIYKAIYRVYSSIYNR